MNRACKNCRFCIYAHSMRGKEEPYCERHSKWIGDTLLCSEWEAVIVPKPKTNADKIRSMTDEKLAEFIYKSGYGSCPQIPVCPQFASGKMPYTEDKCKACWLDWLKQEVSE